MKGMKQRAKKGVYLGKSPYGYTIDSSTRKLVIHESEASVIMMIFQMYSQGDSFAKIKLI
jgi:DNA invertase Pin-like site-specific DNA recombinase